MLQTSPAATAALTAIAETVGATSLRLTPVRVCDHCQDPDAEAFPYQFTPVGWSEPVSMDLCNECYDIVAPPTIPHSIQITCAGCHLPIEGADLDSRTWAHEAGCLGPHHPDYEGCDCDVEYHAHCAPPAEPSFEILDKDTFLLDELEGCEFRTMEQATAYVLANLPHDERPFFISDETGDLVGLVYAGACWGDGEAAKRIEAAIALAQETKAKLSANHKPYSLGAARLACMVLDDVMAALVCDNSAKGEG
jgi:hypothetical protein